MAIRKIARMGHPVLRLQAKSVGLKEITEPSMQMLVLDLFETMHEYGGIGLAAPQVHESIQLAIIEFSADNQRYPGFGNQGPLVLFNPKIEVLDPTLQTFWEGCLSVPELRGQVSRPRKIRVSYHDQLAQERSLEAEGFLATVFQHELDHLWGNLFIDKLADSKSLCFLEEYKRFHHSQGPAEKEV